MKQKKKRCMSGYFLTIKNKNETNQKEKKEKDSGTYLVNGEGGEKVSTMEMTSTAGVASATEMASTKGTLVERS